MDAAIVVDYGSYTIKAGSAASFPNEKEPSIITPAAVQVHTGQDIGNADAPGSQLETQHPVQQGKIVNFDQFESMLHYLVYDLSGWEYGDEGSMVIVEPLLTAKADREHIAQICFEVFNVNGLFIQDSAVLSLYAVGKLAGTLVDIGHGKIDIATVTDGSVYHPGVHRLDYSLQTLEPLLASLLSTTHNPISTPSALESLKPLITKAADSPSDYTNLTAHPPTPQTFTLPDGAEFTITTEGLTLAESLFDPSLLNLASAGLLDSLVDTIYSHPDAPVRKLLAENLYVSGGGSTIPNLPQRLVKELRMHVPPTVNPCLCPLPEYMPATTSKYAAWIGGAILAKVVQQQSQYLIKADYEEAGPYCVHRKCS